MEAEFIHTTWSDGVVSIIVSYGEFIAVDEILIEFSGDCVAVRRKASTGAVRLWATKTAVRTPELQLPVIRMLMPVDPSISISLTKTTYEPIRAALYHVIQNQLLSQISTIYLLSCWSHFKRYRWRFTCVLTLCAFFV